MVVIMMVVENGWGVKRICFIKERMVPWYINHCAEEKLSPFARWEAGQSCEKLS
jgi:hypothetical protein